MGHKMVVLLQQRMSDALTMCLKNDRWIFLYNLKKLEPIFVIFGTQYPDILSL